MNLIQLSALQRRFWMDHQMKWPSAEYNETNYTFKINGSLDLERLQRTYRQLMEEYAPLRSRIKVVDETPYFDCDDIANVKVPFFQIETATDPSIAVDQWIRKTVNQPFDLSKEYPCRFYAVHHGNTWYLVNIVNHVVIDGPSLLLFFQRLSEIYNAQCSAQDLTAEVIAANRSFDELYLQQKEDNRTYWKEYLADADTHSFFHYNKQKQEQEKNSVPFTLGKDTKQRVDDFCAQQHTTAIRFYSSAFAFAMSKLSRSQQLLFDHTLNVRPEGLQDIPGVYMNHLPLKFDFENDEQTFHDVLTAANEGGEAEKRHALSFYNDFIEQDSENAKFPRVINVGIYPIVFNSMKLDLDGCAVSPYLHVDLPLSIDLAFVIENDEEVHCRIRHGHLLDPDFVRSLSEVFREVIAQVIEQPQLALKDIQLLSAEKQAALLAREHQQLEAKEAPNVFLSYFKQRVAAHSDAPAVAYEDKCLSYGELDRMSDAVAAFLQAQGMCHQPIGLSTPKNCEMMVGILGILKSGNIYMPIDYNLPEQRVDMMMEDSGAKAILVTRSTPVDFPSAQTFVIEDLAQYVPEAPAALPTLNPQDTAYIIYTSGTTGTPKGIPIRHATLYQTITTHIPLQQLAPGTRVMQFASVSFDASIIEMFPVLCAGGTLVMPQDIVRKDPTLLFNFLKEEDINMASIPPVLLSTLPHEPLPELRTIMLGGDSATLSAIRYWNAGRRMVNSYGPAENGVEATYCIFNENSPKNDIGTTVPGVCCYVLDDHFHLMPDNAIGALYIGGVKLTDGYLNRPELNAEKFVPNPFVTDEERAKGENLRIYNTGDLVIRQADGHLLFIGRSDFQVKLNGFRIELAEVETRIQEFDNLVKATIVTVVEHGNQKQLVAYIKTDHPEDFPTDQLRQHLLNHLPVYMVPAILYPMEDFPYNNSGKVDRKKLPIPTVSASTQQSVNPPATPTEKELAAIWQTLLPGSVIGREDDFISLGGDSLAIISMSFAIEQKWGLPIKASDIYKYIQLKDLAGFIELQQQKAGNKTHADQKVIEGPVPLSPSQMALWLHCIQSEQVKISYNCPCVFELPITSDVQALETALNKLAELQESFRMSFPIDKEGYPYIAIAPYQHFDLQVKTTTEAEVRNEVARQMSRAFDLESAPLYDVVLYAVDQKKYVFSMVMHHLISDGWSEQLIQDVLKKAAAGGEVDWSLYKGSYLPYALEANDFAKDPEFEERMDYWKEQLRDTSDLSLFKAKTGREDDNTACHLTVDLPQELATKVAAFCQQGGNTPFEIYSAVYMRLLAKMTKQNDFAIGFPYLGRESSAYHYVVGYFVNALPLCYKAAYNEMDFYHYLAAVKQSLVDASTHSVSLDQLVKWYRASSGEQDAQLLQTMFVMAEREDFYDYWTSEFVSHNLVFNVLTDKDKVSCYMEYRSACFSDTEVQAMVSAYLTLLEGLVGHPEARIDSHGLAAAAYIQEVVNENRILNHAHLDAPLFLDMFAANVKAIPEHEAIAYGEESVTYGELEEMSNRVAACITTADIKRPTSIAINRVASIETLATMIGIFKAGCCYVPIDVELPDERRDFILQDARCSMIFNDEGGLVGKVLHPEKTDLFDKGNYAYIIYTSGTTGIPKGVPIGHRALANVIDNMIRKWNLTTESRTLLFSSISFDASVTELFSPLAAGATMVIAEQYRRKDIAKLADLIEEQHVTNTQHSSPILPLLPRREFPCLKTLTVGGESIPVSVLEFWGSGHTMINAYGPTESTVSATFGVIGENYEPNDIGTALDGVSCYILDENMNMVPANMEGELYLGGLQLTDGYLNRPELNVERFVKNPFVHPDDAALGLNTILYKTGDIAIRRPNGHIIFIGRADRQVKWHGYRIELSEIEKHLLAYAEVEEAIVEIKKKDDREDLVAYIKSGVEIQAETLQGRLFEELPYYMVPSKWAVLKEFPLTINGKTDKRRLPEPELIVKDSVVEAETEEEKELLDDVRDFMGTDIIGVETDLLDAGMTSMQIMEWMVRIAKRQRYDITISTVYKNRTIRKMLKDHSEKNYLWANEYDAAKPVMVFICGFPDFHPLYDSFMQRFSKHYSIFVFDSYNNYFADKKEVSLDILLQYYLEVVEKELKGKQVDVVSGFCAGAEIAMHFGAYIQQHAGYAPRVLMLEGTYDRSRSEWVNEVMSNEINDDKLSITSRLVQSFPPISYKEDVILCLAKQVTMKPLKNAEEITDSELIQQDIEEVERNNRNWNTHYAGFPIYMLDEDHWTFLENSGLDVIEKAVMEHWL